MQFPIYTSSPEATQKWAKEFATLLKPGMVVGLTGPLGAGKTLAVTEIVRALGYTGVVQSPSYALVNEYIGPILIYHLDFFRLEANADWDEIGISHYLADPKAIAFVEWPEKCPEAEMYLHWHIHYKLIDTNSREITATKLPK